MRDVISRKEAIDAICEHGTELERRGITVLSVANHKQATVDLLWNLPSADRRGRWEWEGFNIVCSECDYSPCFDSTEPLYHYCPNCGARMEETP